MITQYINCIEVHCESEDVYMDALLHNHTLLSHSLFSSGALKVCMCVFFFNYLVAVMEFIASELFFCYTCSGCHR